MIVLLGDYVALSRTVGDDVTTISGRVSGIVLNEMDALKYIYIKGVDTSLWMSDNWQFESLEEESEDE